jgi:hypothetical protein
LGLLDNIIHNIRKNFVFIEFRQYTKSIIIQVIEIPVETYNFVGKIKRYYTLLQQVYKIICNEFRNTSAKMNLQIVVKTINDSARPDGIIFIFFMFNVYPRIIENLVLLFIITKKTKTIRKTTKEVRCFYIKQ